MPISKDKIRVAYFSMEIAIQNEIKSFGGGLGVLAGDFLKAAADSKTPMLGVTLLNDKGYFKQKLTEDGWQREESDEYDYSQFKEMVAETSVNINGDEVKVHAWEYQLETHEDYPVPIYFLDTDIEGNAEKYRDLTGKLYGGDQEYRLMQEIVLGRAGVKILSLLGYKNIERYHLNEGHAALAGVQLYLDKRESVDLNRKSNEEIINEVREECVFTTHTPVEAGHDVFPMEMVERLQPDFPREDLQGLIRDNNLNMSRLALYFSSYVNGVALKHKEVSMEMFPEYEISAITNGVHSKTWTSPDFKELFDKNIPNWRNCSLSLRNAFNIPKEEIWNAHQDAKKRLLDYVKKEEDVDLSLDVFTIGFARRMTQYKRPTLLLYDMDELLRIHKEVGEMQIIYAGKAHPDDHRGKELIQEINHIADEYRGEIDIVFLEGYDMKLAKNMIPGVDVWLNTPLPPNEASGTSGMKAAHNGVPHFSTLDGWWLEGYVREKTGWTIGKEENGGDLEEINRRDAYDLYKKLEEKILPYYYENPERWRSIMQYSIAINASFFNSERMLREYTQEAYI